MPSVAQLRNDPSVVVTQVSDDGPGLKKVEKAKK